MGFIEKHPALTHHLPYNGGKKAGLLRRCAPRNDVISTSPLRDTKGADEATSLATLYAFAEGTEVFFFPLPTGEGEGEGAGIK